MNSLSRKPASTEDVEVLPLLFYTSGKDKTVASVSQEMEAFTRRLVSLILDEEFEYGIDTKADAFVRHYMKLNALLTKDWLNQIFLDNFSNVSLLTGVLRIIAHMDHSEIYPQGPKMAEASLSHENTEVQECAIRAFENWGAIESLQILENLNVSTPWLQEYIDEVVLDLQKEHNVSTHQKN